MRKMITKKMFLFALLCSCCLCAFLFKKDAFAASPITNAIVTDFENTTYGGVYNTYFDVSISNSANYTCSITGRFHCIDAGDWYLRPGYNTRYTVKDDGGGDYTVTIIYNGSWLGHDVQRAQGTVHCDAKKATLTAYAVTEYKEEGGKGYHKYLKKDGTVSGWLASAPSNALVQKEETNNGGSASVRASSFSPIAAGYEFTSWGSSCGGTTADTCTKNNLTGNTNVYAYYNRVDEFMGTSRVLKEDVSWNDSMVSAGTGVQFSPLWKPDNTNANSYTANNSMVVNSCDPVDGCSVVFRHYMKRTQGSGESRYSVSKSVNGDSSTVVELTATSGLKDNEGIVVKEDIVTMFPGQKVCETLYFDSKKDSSGSFSGRIQTTVCAAAVATVGADIDIQIRDQQSSSSYDEYGKNDNIYTKPTDTVDLKGAYNPAYRVMYNISLQAPSKTNGFANNGKTIGETFNANVDPDWDNVFSINLDNNTNANHCSGDYKYYIRGTSKFPAGRPASYDGEVGYAVGDKDVGKTVKAQAATNVCEYGKNTPKQVSLTYSDSAAFTATVDTTDKRSKEVSFMVPYNFSNSTRITTSEDKIIYAGESTTIDYVINVGVKENSETNGTYATQVPDASWGLRVSYDGGASWSENISLGEGDLNSGNEYKFEGGEEKKGGTEGTIINVPDISAGAKVCFQSWVYPADSGGPRNLNPSEFSGTAYSTPVCLTVAKKPSFQVWGGNIYSAGDVKTLTSNKIHVAGRTTYAPIVESPVYHVFGSWTELELVANTKAEGLASGAGTGFNVNPDGIGGSEESTLNYCLRSTLSFANSNCNGSLGFGNSVEKNLEYSNKTELISRFASLEEGNYEIEEHNEENRVEIGEGVTVAKGNTKIITARNGTVVITRDIRYGDDKYNTLAEIPKLIIYAHDIKIKCDVGQIDAVLIAEGNVNTCVDGNDETPSKENNQARSAKQLVIRGSVVANTLSLNRTYGAATGDNSIQSAEIINYDSSLYLWANSWADVSTSGDLTEAAIYEVAPRY